MITILVLLILMTLTSLLIVIGKLLNAVISLAVTSVLLTILMFKLNSPIAAVFELSVCAGLITVVFISVVSLTKVFTQEEQVVFDKNRIKRFWFLPVLVMSVCIALALIPLPANLIIAESAKDNNLRNILWNSRQLDLFGQIFIILAGVIGVVVLFKDKIKEKTEI